MSQAVAIFTPSALLTVTIERSAVGEDQMHIHLGGQGVWVARMIARWGVRSLLCATFGGETGAVARSLLADDNVEVHAAAVRAWNGGYVHDRRTGSRSELVEVPPGTLLRHEIDDLYSTTLAASFNAELCVLTGTHRHPVLPDAVYRRLAHDLHSNGVRVLADVSGDQLSAVLEGGVTMIKVSEEDLRRDGTLGSMDNGGDPMGRALEQLVEMGAEHAVISCGERPAHALIDGERYEVVTPTMAPVDHRGAGDAMTGVLAVGLARELSADQLLRRAAAAGAATVVRHGYATGSLEAIESLARKVIVRRVPRAR
jgi:1-phosphofructokinase